MSTVKLAASLFILLALFLSAVPVRAETVDCTPITALPAVIAVQGIYCFTGNLDTAITSGNAITITANGVVLDLNGYKLGGLAAGLGTQTFGIFAPDRQNITIKNGTVRGFYWGILLEGSSNGEGGGGHVVEDIRADVNTGVGIQVDGAGSIVRNNLVVKTGLTTTLGANADATGIIVRGVGLRVLNNDVISTQAQGTGIARGIFFANAFVGFAVNNRITGLPGPGTGLNSGSGIEFAVADSQNKFRDNLTTNVTTPYTGSGGINAGNNN